MSISDNPITINGIHNYNFRDSFIQKERSTLLRNVFTSSKTCYRGDLICLLCWWKMGQNMLAISVLFGTRYACHLFSKELGMLAMFSKLKIYFLQSIFTSSQIWLAEIMRNKIKTNFILWTISWPIMILPYDMWQTFNWMAWDMNNLVCFMPYFWH